jgi:hypothetical protein
MISKSWQEAPITFLNHSKWRKFEKDLPKCSVIDRRLSIMGQFTLTICVFSLQIAPLAIKLSQGFKSLPWFPTQKMKRSTFGFGN